MTFEMPDSMFTGLIQRIGALQKTSSLGHALELVIDVSPPFTDLDKGESIAVDGVCLTVTGFGADHFAADVSPETLRKSILGKRRTGDRVNLERALRLTDRLGGHIVTGHVDGVGKVVKVRSEGSFTTLTCSVPTPSQRYLVEKGSVTVNGVSLTVASVAGNEVTVAVIPTTLAETTLGDLKPGAQINIETDILGKYMEKLLPGRKESGLADRTLWSLLTDSSGVNFEGGNKQ